MIPVIDLANDAPEDQARAIKSALGSIGFFQVCNSGIPIHDIGEMFEQSRELFNQPLETKERFAADKIGSGYVRPHEQALGLYKRDNKEAFQYGRQSAYRAQPLPTCLDEDRLKSFYSQCHHVSQRLLELFARALGLPMEYFCKAHSYGLNTAVSMIHYPALSAEQRIKARETDIRSGEHKDWGTLTMLFQQHDGQPGLQVYLPLSTVPLPPVDTLNNSEYTTTGYWGWFNAPIPPPGSFLVNVGLAMELWSGGAYRATLHRVVFPEGQDDLKDRFSLAYFVQPDDQVEIQPLDGSSAPVTSGALFGAKLLESLDRIKNLPESAL